MLMKAVLSDHEKKRLAALYQYQILDTPAEAVFDDLTSLAAQICDTPIALISLVDAERQWFKSKLGLRLSETERSVAFCNHAILQNEPLIVEDARKDPRFANTALVNGEPYIKFYAGAPLITSDGLALGTLCVIDRIPRKLTSKQITALQKLSRQAVSQIELRKNLVGYERAESLLIAQKRILEVITTSTSINQALNAVTEQQKEILQTIFDRIPVMLGFFDQQGKLQMVNREWVNVLGWSLEELQESPDILTKFYPDPEYRQEVWEFIEKAEDRQWRNFKTLVKDGRLLNTSWANVRLSDGRTIGIGQDITDRLKAEKSLHESEERFRLLVNGVKDYAIFMLDANGYVTSWNTGAAAIKGYEAEEIIGKHFSCFYPPEDVAQGKAEQVLQLAATAGRVENEGWRVRKDGSYFWANVLITALRDETGKICGFSKITRDITKQKRVEETLQGYNKELADFKFALDESAIVAITDHTGAIQYANNKFCEI
jgi:PAS domain S-box-containing protein